MQVPRLGPRPAAQVSAAAWVWEPLHGCPAQRPRRSAERRERAARGPTLCTATCFEDKASLDRAPSAQQPHPT